MSVCSCPFDCLAPISIYRVKMGTTCSGRPNFWAACLTCYQVKFSSILLADAQNFYYITGTNSCLCCVKHMNMTESRFSPSHLVLAHFLCNGVCSHTQKNVWSVFWSWTQKNCGLKYSY